MLQAAFICEFLKNLRARVKYDHGFFRLQNLVADYDDTQPFQDPFCGSGTLAIEAAWITTKRAVGLNRRFGFEQWLNLKIIRRANMFFQTLPMFRNGKHHGITAQMDMAILQAA